MISIRGMLDVVSSLAPVGNRTNGAQNGASANLAGYNAALVTFHVGAITDGTHTPKVQDSPDDSVWTDVPAALLQGALANLAANSVQRVSYLGDKQFIRSVVTGAGATTGAMYTSSIVRDNSIKKPLS